MSHRATNNNRCKLCQSRPLKFSNSHIIPRSFFHLFRGDEPNSVALDVGGKTNKVQKKQAGFSDPAMLCESCEKKFSNFDSYGWKILGSKNLIETPLRHELQLYGYSVQCDTDLLHRFILSVYWRASVSKIGFAQNFKLYRQYEDQILRDIFASAPISAQYYQTTVFRLSSDYLGPFSKAMFEPLANFQPDKSVICQFNLPELKILTFINGPARFAEWLRINKPDQLILPLLDGSRNQQDLAYLERIHRRFHERAAKSHPRRK
jgi:hypothetical protein